MLFLQPRILRENVEANTGSGGAIFATDTIAGVEYPRTKVTWGSDNTATDTDTANPLPAQLRSSAGTEIATAAAPLRTDPTGTTAQPASKSGTWTLDANSGTDIGDVTINNAAGASAVNIQDGGNTITVDGTVGAGTGFPPVVTDGAAAGTTGTHVLGTDGTNAQILSTNASGHLNIADGGNAITVDGTVTANAGTGPWPVTDNAGSLTVDAPVGTPVATRLSDGAAFLTTTSGRLSVDASAVAVPVTDNAGSLTVDGSVSLAAALPAGTNNIGDVDIASIVPVTASGTIIALNGTQAINVGGYGAVGIQLTGTWTATVEFQATVDGTNWVAIQVWPAGTDTAVTTSTANGLWHAPCGGFQQVRCEATAFTSGTIQVDLQANTAAAKQLVAGSGGTQYDEDTAHVTGDKVTMAGVVQQSADTALSGNLDRSVLQVDSSGFLKVNVKAGATSGTEYTEDAVAPADPVGGQLIARRRDTPASETTADGDVTALNCTANGELYVKHIDAIPVTDNAGSLTVDGTVTANAGTGPWPVTDNAGSLTIDNAALSVTGGGAEATALRVTIANNSTGVLSVDDNGAALSVDHDGVQPNASHTRNEAFSESVALGGELDDTAPVAATEGNVSPLRITAQRAAHANLRNNAGTEIGTAADPIRTNPTGTTAQPVTKSGTWTLDANSGVDIGDVTINNAAGASAVNVQDGGNAITVDHDGAQPNASHTRNEAFSESNAIGGELDDTATVAATEGNVSPLRITAQRGAHVNLRNNAGTEIGTSGNPVRTDTTGTTTQPVAGSQASGAVLTANPVVAGALARTTDPGVVDNGDVVAHLSDTLGKLVTLVGSTHDEHKNGTINRTDTTAADVIAAAGAGVRIAVTSVMVTNASTTVATKVEIRDGTTVKILGYAMAEGGFTHNAGGAPLFISTANTAITGRCATTGANVDIFVSGYDITN